MNKKCALKAKQENEEEKEELFMIQGRNRVKGDIGVVYKKERERKWEAEFTGGDDGELV